MSGTEPALLSLLGAGRAHGVPTGAGYTVLLLVHVASAVVGFGALCLTGLQAWRARAGPGGPRAEAVRRYFRPGINWAARSLYLVPVVGFALLPASGGAFDASDTFVVSGLGIWLAAAALAELTVWPAERRIQRTVTRGWDALDADAAAHERFRRECTRAMRAALLLGGLFVAAVVVMVAKP